jgi:hypothetical protein
MVMTPEQIRISCVKYERMVSNAKITPEQYPTNTKQKVDVVDSLAHARWMCGEILSLLIQGKVEKAERWLCFVQGVLWVNGICSIDEMRDDNRG